MRLWRHTGDAQKWIVVTVLHSHTTDIRCRRSARAKERLSQRNGRLASTDNQLILPPSYTIHNNRNSTYIFNQYHIKPQSTFVMTDPSPIFRPCQRLMADMHNAYRGVGGAPYNPADTPNAVRSFALSFMRFCTAQARQRQYRTVPGNPTNPTPSIP